MTYTIVKTITFYIFLQKSQMIAELMMRDCSNKRAFAYFINTNRVHPGFPPNWVSLYYMLTGPKQLTGLNRKKKVQFECDLKRPLFQKLVKGVYRNLVFDYSSVLLVIKNTNEDTTVSIYCYFNYSFCFILQKRT